MTEIYRSKPGIHLWYVAHPLGAGDVRELNKARALRWLRWLLDNHPSDAFCMPWYAYTEVLSEAEGRTRGLRDDLACVDCCDGVVLVGGVLSPGMETELHRAVEKGKEIMTYLHLGAEPPGKDA